MAYEGGKTEIECPFCHKGRVTAFHWPPHRQAKTSRISSKSATVYTFKPEKWDIIGGCPVCGKSQKEIQKAVDSGTTKEISHKERLEKFKKSGLPTKIEG